MPVATDERWLDLRHDRRRFLITIGQRNLLFGPSVFGHDDRQTAWPPIASCPTRFRYRTEPLRLILPCGDVMSGRGIDQAMRRPGDPRLYERFVRSARDYVALAEQASGRYHGRWLLHTCGAMR